MNNIENLVIDSDPIIKIKDLILITEFNIDKEQEISISINNSIILGPEDIIKIDNNYIELAKKIDIKNKDNIVIIYNKI